MQTAELTMLGCEQNQLAATIYGDPASVPIIMVHGGGQSRFSWKQTAGFLAGAGYLVVTFDARGHGGSAWSPEGHYSLDYFEGDLRAVLANFAKPVAIFGASLGGLTILNAFANDPKGLAADSIVLVDIVPDANQAATEQIALFMKRTLGGFASLEEAAAALADFRGASVTGPVTPGLARTLRQSLDGRFYWHWDPRIMELEDIQPHEEIQARLCEGARRLSMPVLVVRGGLSDVVRPAEIARFKALKPDAEVITVAGMGHAVIGKDISGAHLGLLDFVRRAAG